MHVIGPRAGAARYTLTTITQQLAMKRALLNVVQPTWLPSWSTRLVPERFAYAHQNMIYVLYMIYTNNK